MATTTFAAIRAQMVTAILGVTPSSQSGVKFTKSREEMDFREWASASDIAANRYYSIRNLFEPGEIQMHDGNAEMRALRCEVVVAYQHNHRWGDGMRGLDDVMEEDRVKLDEVLGISSGTYTPNACTINPEFRVEPEDGVSFLVLEYDVIHHRSVNT